MAVGDCLVEHLPRQRFSNTSLYMGTRHNPHRLELPPSPMVSTTYLEPLAHLGPVAMLQFTVRAYTVDTIHSILWTRRKYRWWYLRIL